MARNLGKLDREIPFQKPSIIKGEPGIRPACRGLYTFTLRSINRTLTASLEGVLLCYPYSNRYTGTVTVIHINRRIKVQNYVVHKSEVDLPPPIIVG